MLIPLSFAQAHELLNHEPCILLDVRTEEEYEAGHAKGAHLLPLDAIDADTAAEVIPTLSTPILLYCRTGRRTKLAAAQLDALGYTTLYDLGGLNGWPYGIDYGAY